MTPVATDPLVPGPSTELDLPPSSPPGSGARARPSIRRQRGRPWWTSAAPLAVAVAGGIAVYLQCRPISPSWRDLVVREDPSRFAPLGRLLIAVFGDAAAPWRVLGASAAATLAALLAALAARWSARAGTCAALAVLVVVHPAITRAMLDIDGALALLSLAVASCGAVLAQPRSGRRLVALALALAAAAIHPAAAAVLPWVVIASFARPHLLRRPPIALATLAGLAAALTHAVTFLHGRPEPASLVDAAALMLGRVAPTGLRDLLVPLGAWGALLCAARFRPRRRTALVIATAAAGIVALTAGFLAGARDAHAAAIAAIGAMCNVALLFSAVNASPGGSTRQSIRLGAVAVLLAVFIGGSAGVIRTARSEREETNRYIEAVRSLPPDGDVMNIIAGRPVVEGLPPDARSRSALTGWRKVGPPPALRSLSPGEPFRLWRFGPPADEGPLAAAPPAMRFLAAGAISSSLRLLDPPDGITLAGHRAKDEPTFAFDLPPGIEPTRGHLAFIGLAEIDGKPRTLVRALDPSIVRPRETAGTKYWVWRPSWRSMEQCDNELCWERGDLAPPGATIHWTIAVVPDHDENRAAADHDGCTFDPGDVQVAPFRRIEVARE